MSILNESFIMQVYISYLDLASFSRRVSAREPCGQFWDENEKLCSALASILLGSRCPEKHSIECKPIGTIFALGITFHSVSRTPDFWCRSIIYDGRHGGDTAAASPRDMQKQWVYLWNGKWKITRLSITGRLFFWFWFFWSFWSFWWT